MGNCDNCSNSGFDKRCKKMSGFKINKWFDELLPYLTFSKYLFYFSLQCNMKTFSFGFVKDWLFDHLRI